MTIMREFLSNFTKIKRTPVILMHVLPPIVVTTLFLAYYASAGYRIISDVRMFFVLLQIGYPIFVSIVVPIFTNLDRNINGMQNALGLVESRSSVYLGKLLFLLFLSAVSMIIYVLCFYVGAGLILNISSINLGSCLIIISIFLFSNLFVYFIHIPIAFRYGSSISVLFGISGTIFAGFFENAIGDKIWPLIPWEWGIRFLENYFEYSGKPVFYGVVSLIIITSAVLAFSILWFCRWEGKITQE